MALTKKERSELKDLIKVKATADKIRSRKSRGSKDSDKSLKRAATKLSNTAGRISGGIFKKGLDSKFSKTTLVDFSKASSKKK